LQQTDSLAAPVLLDGRAQPSTGSAIGSHDRQSTQEADVRSGNSDNSTAAVVNVATAVTGIEVKDAGQELLHELLQAQPNSFEGCWPASNGAMASVLTAYMKSLFVLTRAAAEAVMDL
jgi:hypothetical protein